MCLALEIKRLTRSLSPGFQAGVELLSEACREVHGNEYLRPVLGAALVMGAKSYPQALLDTNQSMRLLQRAALGSSCYAPVTLLLALATALAASAQA